jgi:hypothetical protein
MTPMSLRFAVFCALESFICEKHLTFKSTANFIQQFPLKEIFSASQCPCGKNYFLKNSFTTSTTR